MNKPNILIQGISDFIDFLLSYMNLYDWELYFAVFMIIICPITWNLVARCEFNTKIFSKIAGDNRKAADIFAHVLIEMGILRNYLFTRAIKHQPHLEFDPSVDMLIWIAAYLLLVSGTILVMTSFYRLGIHGIYYGDYFGILMKERVTAFPYDVLENPMYVGSTCLFLGGAIYYKSPVGLLLSLLAWVMYQFASILENPMTRLIYSEKNIEKINKMNERLSNEKEAKAVNKAKAIKSSPDSNFSSGKNFIKTKY